MCIWCKKFSSVDFQHVHWEKNEVVDSLAKQAVFGDIDPVLAWL